MNKKEDDSVKSLYICPTCGTKDIRRNPKLNISYNMKRILEKQNYIETSICKKCNIKGANLYDYSFLDGSFFTSYLSPIKIDKCPICGKKTKELFIVSDDSICHEIITCRECREICIESGMIDKNIKVFS